MRLTTFVLFFIIAFAGLIVLPALVLANHTGALPGHTGAPAVGGRDCTFCHAGVSNSGPGGVAVQVAATNYIPGTYVLVDAKMVAPLQNVNKNGYQIAAYDSANTLLSGWVLADPIGTQIFPRNSNHVTHTLSGTTKTTWQQYLLTPRTPTNFTFYTAGNDANGNSLNTGDRIYTTSQAMTPGPVQLSLSNVLPKVNMLVPLLLNSPTDANKTYVMGASLGNAGVVVAGKPLPLAPDTLFFLSVLNSVPGLFQNYTGNLDANGAATAGLLILQLPALAGLTVHHAYVVIDPNVPGGIGTVSNGLPIKIAP